MGRKKEKSGDSTFTRLLGWTVVLALVFSAGMITGQRLLRKDSVPPLVSLSVTSQAEAATKSPENPEPAPLKTTFSFYEHLSSVPDGLKKAPDSVVAAQKVVAVVPKAAEKAVEKPAEAVVEKPVEVVEKPVEVDEKPAVKTIAEVPAVAEPVEKPVAEKPAIAPDKVEAKTEALIDKVASVLGGDENNAPVADKGAEVAGRYTVQVGNHGSKASAVRELARLRAMGLNAHMVAVEVEGNRFYRVRVGKFENGAAASAEAKRLAADKRVHGTVTPL